MKLALALVALAACGGSAAKPAPPPSGDNCSSPDGGRPVFGIGDAPSDMYTTLQGHAPGHCLFEAGPHAARDASHVVRTTSSGFVWGTCGSARYQYLVSKPATLAFEAMSQDAQVTPTSATLGVGQSVNIYANRKDACGRMLVTAGLTWSLGTCDGKVKLDEYSQLATPTENLALVGVAPGTCELVAKTGDVTATFALTIR